MRLYSFFQKIQLVRLVKKNSREANKKAIRNSNKSNATGKIEKVTQRETNVFGHHSYGVTNKKHFAQNSIVKKCKTKLGKTKHAEMGSICYVERHDRYKHT